MPRSSWFVFSLLGEKEAKKKKKKHFFSSVLHVFLFTSSCTLNEENKRVSLMLLPSNPCVSCVSWWKAFGVTSRNLFLPLPRKSLIIFTKLSTVFERNFECNWTEKPHKCTKVTTSIPSWCCLVLTPSKRFDQSFFLFLFVVPLIGVWRGKTQKYRVEIYRSLAWKRYIKTQSLIFKPKLIWTLFPSFKFFPFSRPATAKRWVDIERSPNRRQMFSD